ncbi:MAG: fimbrillin family protein [Bacteroidales bacterium]
MEKIFLVAFTIAAMVSCSKEAEKIDSTGDNRIVFGSSIEAATRVADNATQFSAGDKICVIGYHEATAAATTNFSTPFMNKAVFTYNSSKFTSTDATAFWKRGMAHNFYAYYPSDLAVNPLTATAPTATLTVAANTGIGVDVMQANAETAVFDKTSTSTALTFIHRLSKVRFNVIKEANAPLSNLTGVKFTMANNTGTLNVATGEVTNGGSNVVLSKTATQEITATATSAFNTEWVVLPKDMISDVKLTINGMELAATNLAGTTTVAGQITTITITVKATGIVMTSTITAWVDDPKNGTVG